MNFKLLKNKVVTLGFYCFMFYYFKNLFFILNYFCYNLFKMSNNWHIFF